VLPVVLLLGWPGASERAGGAELRLRAECTAAGPLVRLADVSEITAADPAEAQRLAEIELFPAPVHPGQRFLLVRELEDLLLLRGVDLAQHRISGSSRVVINGPHDARGSAPPLPSSAARKARERVEQAVKQYLDQQAGQPTTWQLEFKLSDQQLRSLWPPAGEISVRGGHTPWAGPQVLEIEVAGPAGRETWRLHVNVQTAPAVVVTTRSLTPGTVLRTTDVRLQTGLLPNKPEECFYRLEQVVGHETTRALPAGVVLQRASVRAPLMVRRGEVVTVYARAAGIRVRTTARARDEGAMGELVEVESLSSRKTYFARVCGMQEVEVFARPAQAAAAPLPQAQGGSGVLPAAGSVSRAHGRWAVLPTAAPDAETASNSGRAASWASSVAPSRGPIGAYGYSAPSGHARTSAAPVANRPLRAQTAARPGF